ncbi:hypothetical protein P863_08115 [Mycobacterium avium subsp. silvaticum ATCC 49884]|nr:hypothetical protein P863_08115 [Mycobacterium avium subsp. silvaticum ATCC 49884]
MASSLSTVPTSSMSSRLVVDRLTATVRRRPSSRQERTCCNAMLSVRLEILRINPARSATGRNSSGSNVPRVGCCQRSTASTLWMLPSRPSILGW